MRTHIGKYETGLGILVIMLSGCAAMKQLPTPDEATAIEQFLMTQAIERSLNSGDSTVLPLPQGSTFKLETTGLSLDQRFFLGAVGGWLGEQGLRLSSDGQRATYRIQILVQSLGTEQSRTFFGMPPVQSVLIPFALPEITLYAAQYQSGFTRFRLDVFEAETGKFIRSTPWLQASTFYNEYTLLFFIDFHRTDLILPLEEQETTSKSLKEPSDIEDSF